MTLLSLLQNAFETSDDGTIKESCRQLISQFSMRHYPESWRDQVTVVIPCRNEEKNLPAILEQARLFCKEMIVIDGQSHDQSVSVAKGCGATVIQDQGRGKGLALRTAIPFLKTPVTVFLDADGSHHPYDIPALVSPILLKMADHVTGSRNTGGSDELHGDINKFLRMMGSDLITLGINYRFGVRLTDSQNGFRAILTEVLKRLDLRSRITTIEQEMIMETLRLGYRMAEVPTHEYARRSGDSHIVLRRVWWAYLFTWVRGLLKRRCTA